MPTLLLIGLRNLLRNGRRTLITLAAVAVGVTSIVVVDGLLNGLERTLVTTVTQGITGALQVHRHGLALGASGAPRQAAMPQALVAAVRGVPGVAAASGRLGFIGMLSHGDQSLFAAVTGVQADSELQVCPEQLKLLLPGGSFVGPQRADALVLTPGLAHAVALGGGQTATLLVNGEAGLAAEDLRLTGTMAINWGGEQRFALTSLALAQRLLDLPDQVTEIVVAVEPVAEADRVAAAVRQTLGPDYDVVVWHELARSVQQSMRADEMHAHIIAISFTLLMLLGVGNTMLMSVLERTREVGTMLALGMRRRRVVQMLLVEALGIGIAGALAGCALGGCAVALLRWHGIAVSTASFPLPFVVRPFVEAGYVAWVCAAAAAGAVLSCLYPAWRATQLRPVQALAGGR